MRLHAQTPKIEGGFVLLPKKADWLETYLSELLSFPSSKYNDQVDSTVYALAWIAQNPTWGGTIIDRHWLHYYTALPDEPRKRVFMSWDTALKDGGHSDWTVCTVWILFDGVFYLQHVERGIFGYSELRDIFNMLVTRFDPYQILIEETATGRALKEDRVLLRRSSIKLLPVDQDRMGRLYVQQAKFQDGHVQLPKNASFMSQVEKELLSYPYGITDDIVDSIALALKYGGKGYDTTMNWV